jgi:hypothetical protein
VIRFGGNSVDRHYPGATAAALAGLARLVRATGWSVLYSEDLAQYNAAAVTSDVSHVRAALGGYLAGLDCGNEPDLYQRIGDRPQSYTESQYIAQDAACLHAAAAAAPGVALAGPDTFETSWLPGYGAQREIRVQWINQHYYAMGCEIQADMSDAQLVSYLLSPGQAAREAAVFTATRNAAAAQSARPRISETDSAGCDSAPGISNTYATALWAIDFMLTAAEDGMDGINFYTGLNIKCASYSPLCGTPVSYQYAPQAEYYGLLFTHLLGAGRLLPVNVESGVNVTAFAVSPPTGGLRLMVENLSATPTTAALQVGGNPQSATVLYLTAQSPLATSGITIQGAQVAADGSFTPGAPSMVGCAAGTCPVTIAPYTAVIVTVG